MKFNPLRKGVPYLSLDNRVDIRGYKNVCLLAAIGMLTYPSETEFFASADVLKASNRITFCFTTGVEKSNRTREDCCYEVYHTYFMQNPEVVKKFKDGTPYECTDSDIQKVLEKLAEEDLTPVELSNSENIVEDMPVVEKSEEPLRVVETLSEPGVEPAIADSCQLEEPVKETVKVIDGQKDKKSSDYWLAAMGDDISNTIHNLKTFHTAELQMKLSEELKKVIGNEFPTLAKALEDNDFATALCEKFGHLYTFLYYRIYVIGQKL